jgi:hypothetical protein
VLRIFIALKNPSSSAGFKLANLGSNVKHVTFRPPRETNKVFMVWALSVRGGRGERIYMEQAIGTRHLTFGVGG